MTPPCVPRWPCCSPAASPPQLMQVHTFGPDREMTAMLEAMTALRWEDAE
ncbi:hypothetical protein [Mitsuaria sp. GD03876]|nr:hypothetical protein [Mitsuaria sp. GD03876]MDH0867723.1 hypothetical protein [Mitsuaria sp. GD03876]